ncbi:MAG: pseudouridine-5'-phosphate glycosidase [Saprospiraceae bacterium]|nr:pseudouridine-5'-phosphate glycosidase [Saprospiraceae bacterium]
MKFVKKMPALLHLSPEVESALHEGRPVVALESTIIAHGMPYPQNVETAHRVEQAVRDAGATPATCAVWKGMMRAGLTAAELETFGRLGPQIPKASRRDMAYLVSRGLTGATTVASTMIIAHAAGIRVFATGGIGGVHRGAAHTFDISADLQELAQTPVTVVCAGAKSILDLGLTLEYLETHGVPVVGYGTSEFPAFYTRKSGFNVDFRLDTPSEIAALIKAQEALGLKNGIVVTNPIPEVFEPDALLIEKVTLEALAAAEREGVKGKAITPYLLSYIEKTTGGMSLAANIELVLNNARLAAAIAVSILPH